MNEEDMSNVLKQFSSMVNNNNLPDNIKDVLNNLNSSSNSTSSNNSGTSHEEDNSSQSNTPNIDIEMILKIKSIMDKMNSQKDPRANLLISLKPYLNEKRKGKVEQYIQFLNLSRVIEMLHSNGGDKNSDE